MSEERFALGLEVLQCICDQTSGTAAPLSRRRGGEDCWAAAGAAVGFCLTPPGLASCAIEPAASSAPPSVPSPCRVPVTLSNGPAAPEYVEQLRHAKNPAVGTKQQMRSGSLWLDQADAQVGSWLCLHRRCMLAGTDESPLSLLAAVACGWTKHMGA